MSYRGVACGQLRFFAVHRDVNRILPVGGRIVTAIRRSNPQPFPPHGHRTSVVSHKSSTGLCTPEPTCGFSVRPRRAELLPAEDGVDGVPIRSTGRETWNQANGTEFCRY